MRLIEGDDLQAVLADGPLKPARAVRTTEQVAESLHATHRVGLVEVSGAWMVSGIENGHPPLSELVPTGRRCGH